MSTKAYGLDAGVAEGVFAGRVEGIEPEEDGDLTHPRREGDRGRGGCARRRNRRPRNLFHELEENEEGPV